MYWCPVDLILNKPPEENIRCAEKTVTTNTLLQLYAMRQTSGGTIYQN